MPFSLINKPLPIIHQYAPHSEYGDGITNGLFFTQKLLKQAGFISEIYSHYIADELIGQVIPAEHFEDNKDHILLYHFSMGHNYVEWVENLSCKKFMVYHNITPAKFFPEKSEHYYYAHLGRELLNNWSKSGLFEGAIGDSPLNARELKDAGYHNIDTIPLLVDSNKVLQQSYSDQEIVEHSGHFTILFVGRLAENKCQHELLDVFEAFCQIYPHRAELLIVGGTTSPAYQQRLQQSILSKGLGNRIQLCGKVSSEKLYSYYRSANAYLSLSEHEGFGMPLLEAMLLDVPVIAYDCGGIDYPMGCGGLIVKQKSAKEIAAILYLIASDAAFKRQIISSQRQNCQRFSAHTIFSQLLAYFQKQHINTPEVKPPAAKSIRFQIEGPFDTSYSLAILNREMALSLQEDNQNISLLSLEGQGRFEPDQTIFEQHPSLKQAWQNSQRQAGVEISLRLIYPPISANMPGKIKIMHNYGWEESAFPQDYVDGFNLNCDGITVMSNYVKKVLQDNGVRIPVSVVGVGCDHITDKSQKGQHKLTSSFYKRAAGEDFTFLHISSCFPRKGVDVLLKAYSTSFTSNDAVRLIIKTFPNQHHNIEDDVKQLQKNPSCPKIEVINEDLDESNVFALYQLSDALVAPSRGEGFGLPMAEAMLFEIPVITTGYGGQMDFCNETNSYLIDYHFSKAKTHMNLFNSYWAEPDKDHLAQLMQQVRQLKEKNCPSLKEKTALAKQTIEQHFQWSHIRERTYQFIEQLEQQKPFTLKPLKTAWISSWNSKCGIAEYSQLLSSEFSDNQLLVFANRNAELIDNDKDNVIRCWQTGIDDSLNELFNQIIQQQCSSVVIQFNFGFFSLKAYSDLLLKLKQHNIYCLSFFHSTADALVAKKQVSLKEIKPALSIADKLVVHSIEDLNRLKEFGLVENVMLFPHGVSQLTSNIIEQGKQDLYELIKNKTYPELSRLLHISNHQMKRNNKTVLAAFGFLLPHKGIKQLIEAFNTIRKEQKDCCLLLLNALYPDPISSKEHKQCLELIEKSPHKKDIIFITDYLDNTLIAALLQLADIIVFPYQQTKESSSAAIRGGLRSGKPVLCTPLAIFDDVAEVIHYLPGSSETEIAKGCLDLICTLEQKNTKQREQQQKWIETHNWPRLSQRLKNIIQSNAT